MHKKTKEAFIIRNWQPDDLPDIFRMMGYIPAMEIPDYSVFREAIIGGRFPKLLVAEKDNKPVGIVIYHVEYHIDGKGYVWLACLSVEVEYRRRGIATELIKKKKQNRQKQMTFRFAYTKKTREQNGFIVHSTQR